MKKTYVIDTFAYYFIKCILMNYTLNYAENWNENDIVDVLSTISGNNILTRVSKEKFDKINIRAKILQIDMVKAIMKHITSPHQEFTLSEYIYYYHIYDEKLNLIFHNNVIIQLCDNLNKMIHRSKDVKKFNENRIGIISGGISEINLVVTAFILLVLQNNNVVAKIDYGVDKIMGTYELIQNDLKINKINIVTGGMENAISHIIADATDNLIICVPSSCSYGYGKNKAPLLSLFECKNKGMLIYNIDNMFGACNFVNQIMSNMLIINSASCLNIGIVSLKDKIKIPYGLWNGVNKKINVNWHEYESTAFIMTNLKESFDYISNNNIIIVYDDSGICTNIISGLLRNFNHNVPIIGVATTLEKTKIMLNGCVPYAVILENDENIIKLCARMTKFISQDAK